MQKWSLIQNQPLLKTTYATPPIITYKKGESLKRYAATTKPHRGACVGLSMTFTNHFRHLRFSNLLRTTNSFYTRLYNRQFL